jgi:hypothetical protein
MKILVINSATTTARKTIKLFLVIHARQEVFFIDC